MAWSTGSFKISSLREDGKEAILVVLEAGNWFGEISLIDLQPRTHDATAVGEAEVLALPRAAFDELMRRHTFSQAICRMLAARTRSLYGMVEDATLRSTRARVARRLLLLAHGDATQAADTRAVVPVSQEALAMMLGITRQTLSKELKLLAAHGAITLGYGRIDIELPVLLERLGSAVSSCAMRGWRHGFGSSSGCDHAPNSLGSSRVFAEHPAEVREVAEAPGQRDVGDRPRGMGRSCRRSRMQASRRWRWM